MISQNIILVMQQMVFMKGRRDALMKAVMVVSPLLALMADQVDQLVKMGIKATHLRSTQPDHSVMAQILEGQW